MTVVDSSRLLLSGTDIPSRTIIKATCVNNCKPHKSFTLVHFDDIRDAIDAVLRSLRDKGADNCGRLSTIVAEPDYHKSLPAPLILDLDANALLGNLKMNQLVELRDAMYACTSSAEQFLKQTQSESCNLTSACVMITISFDTQEVVEFDIVDPLIAEIERNFTNYGSILAKSEVKRDIKTGSIFKFFTEFYRVQDCQNFLESVTDICVSLVKCLGKTFYIYNILFIYLD